VIGGVWQDDLLGPNGLGILAGILAGLVIGKPVGITLFCLAGVAVGLCRLPSELSWRHVIGARIINASKMAILLASVVAGAIGLAWLRWVAPAASPA
jgi:Na+:H+ antiporter, NhaA family